MHVVSHSFTNIGALTDTPVTDYPMIHASPDAENGNQFHVHVTVYLPVLKETPTLLADNTDHIVEVDTEAGQVNARSFTIDCTAALDSGDNGPKSPWVMTLLYELDSTDTTVDYIDVEVVIEGNGYTPEGNRGTVTTPKLPGVNEG